MHPTQNAQHFSLKSQLLQVQTTKSTYKMDILHILTLFSFICFTAAQGAYTRQELAALKKFRPMIESIVYEDYMLSDAYLIPWLRARKLDLGRAKEMLEKNIKWRLDNKIDNIQSEDLSQAEECIKVFHGGNDKRGRPIIYTNMGKWDVRKCALAGKMNVMTRYIIRHCLEGPTKVARSLKDKLNGGNVTQFTAIMEMSGFNLRQGGCLACLPFYATWAYNVEAYYPASSFKYYLPNMPQAFQTIIDFVKPIMTPPTANAITPMSHNRDEWFAIISKVIDVDQIPASLGGKRKETAADREPY